MQTDDKSSGGYSVRKYDIHLLEQLNEEYRAKPLRSSFPQYDPESQLETATRRLHRLNELVDLKEKKALEVGCGRGYLSKSLADQYACSVLGIDIREHVEWQALRSPPNLDYLVLDLSERNPFAEASFDLVVSFVAWEHVMHPFAMLTECCRMLKPKGQMYLCANLYRSPLASHLYRDIYFPFPHLLFSEEVIAEFCLKHGVSKHSFDEYYCRNKLTYSQYKEYFDILNLGIQFEQLRKTELDMDFYERFKDKLARYPRFDLELDFFEVLLVKDYGGLPKLDYLKAALTRERDAGQKAAEKSKAQLSITKRETTRLQAETNTAKAELDSTKAELNNTNAELNNTNAELNNTKAELNNTNAELNNTKAELNNTKAEVNYGKAALVKETTRLQAELNTTKAELGTARAELGTAKAELNTTKAELGTARAELNTTKADLAKEATRLQAELDSTKAELNTAKAGLVKETTRLQAELDSTKAELNTTKAGLVKEATRLQAELNTTRAELTKETTRLQAELDTAKAGLVKETTRLQAELDSTKAELDTTKGELNTAKAELTKEATRLQAGLAKEKRGVQAVRSSLSFQLGHALVRPVRKPGRTAILLSYRLLKMSPRGLKRVIVGVTNKSKLLTSLRSLAETAARSSAKQKQRDAVLQRSKTAGPSTNRADVQETETATRSSTQQEQRRAVSPKSKTADFSTNKAAVLEVVKEKINKIKREMGSGTMVAPEPRRKGLKIAVIMDRFTYDCFKYEANLITFTPDNWQQVLSENRPDFMFVESAWQGNDDSWRYQIVNLGQKPRSQLPQLVQWCKAQNIPTVFWCKEDPAHYNDFLDAARLFDYIYTSDLDCVSRYTKDLHHENVYCLPFAVQPKIHSPLGSGQKIRDIAFAGSWYEGENEFRMQRKEQMACILAPALSHDVDIYDRHYKLNEERFRFPTQYQPYIVGELSYEDMVYAYKVYRLFLNVNSVTRSPTMLPRRVLEILASGTCVLSGQSKAIENLVGSDVVPMSTSPQETELLLKKLLADNELRGRLAHLGLRKVMKEHTYERRLDYVLQTMGIGQGNNRAKEKGVSIIACTNKVDYMESIFANYDRQQYDGKELIIVLNNNRLDLDEWMEEAGKHENVAVYRVDEKEGLGACLNFGIDRARFEYIAKCDDDDYYAPAYLGDAMTAFDYSGADIVGKHTYYVYFEKDKALGIRFPDREFRFTHFIAGATIIARRKVFEKVKFVTDKAPGADTRFRKDCIAKGFKIFSADRFDFVQMRKISKETHTWKMADEEMMKASQIIAFTKDYIPYIAC